MKSVFEASTGIEAHMIKNLLDLNEVESEVFGEHLQGGIGDLQAVGIVRVMVADDDYEHAREIVQEWESSQPAPEPDSSYHTARRSGFGSALIGFILGCAVVVLLTQSAVDESGVDFNGDGIQDQKWEYVNDLIRSNKIDRNRDGEFDEIYEFDWRGNLTTGLLDNDFDGRSETECRFKTGNVSACRTDFDGDGFYESRESYSNGVLRTVSLYDSSSKKLKKKQYFDANRLVEAEIDLNGDGELETRYEYDEFEELIEEGK